MTYKDMKAIERALEIMIEKTEVEKQGIRDVKEVNKINMNEELEKHYDEELERVTRESAEFKTALIAIRNAAFC